MKSAGFNFQDDSVRKVDVNVATALTQFQDLVDAFAKDEDFAQHVLFSAKDPEALRAVDARRWSDFSSKFWQSRDWWFGLQKIVPFLILELLKTQPKNLDKLTRASKFWVKPYRWSYKMDPYSETSTEYLAVLKKLRDQLEECQKAAASVGSEGLKSEVVGKFELFDSLGLDAAAKQKVVAALKQATKAMSSLGLGAYCYGKVTIVNSSKFSSGSAAFYVPNTDEMYVSPEMSGQDVRAICHEVTHRVFHKLNLSARAAQLFNFCADNSMWVTQYAKTSAEENLCEMVSFAAIGKTLSKEGEDALRLAVPKIKLAATSRVARRWILERSFA